jgi:hypothetical protein
MKNRRNPWTPEEVDRLRTMLEANSSIHLIAAKMKRTVHAVKGRVHLMGISLRQVKAKKLKRE